MSCQETYEFRSYEIGIIRKISVWAVDTLPSVQSPFRKLNLAIQKVCKNRYQSFVVLSNLTGVLYFVPIILSGFVAFIGFLCSLDSQWNDDKPLFSGL